MLPQSLWSPPDDWIFSFDEIPTDQNLEDYVVGVLEVGREDGTFKKKELKSLSLVYTSAGAVRDGRKSFGRGFKAPDGTHVLLGNSYLKGTETLVTGSYDTNTVSSHAVYEHWKHMLFTETVKDCQDPVKFLRKKRAHSSTGAGTASKKAKIVESSDDSDDEDSSSDDSQTPRKSSHPSQQQQSWKFVLPVDGVKQSSSEEDKNLIRRLQNELEPQKINIRGLEGDLKVEVEKQGGVLKLIQELVQRIAKIGTAMIGAILKSAMDFSEYIEERCPGAGEFFLEFYKRALDQEVKDLELFLSNRRQLSDVAANPNGELARVGRGLPEDARNALEIARVDITVRAM